MTSVFMQPSGSTLALGSAQQAVWFDQALAPDAPCCVVGGALQFDGRMRLDLWERAIEEVVNRHDALRILVMPGEPIDAQVFVERVAFQLRRHDYSAHADGDAQALQHLRQAFLRPFRLHGSLLWEMEWIQATPTRGYTLFRFHHLVVDGASVSLAGRALIDAYNRLVRGLPEPVEPVPAYVDHLADDRSYLASPRWQQDRDFWLDRFQQAPEPLFPTDAGQLARRPCEQVVWRIPRADFEQMGAVAAAFGGSVAHLLVGAVALYFARVNGWRSEVVVGMPVHNRRNAAEKRTVGMFSSVLPLVVKIDPQGSFETLLRAIGAEVRACYRHQRFPLYEIARALQKNPLQRSRLFDLTVSVEQFVGDVTIEGGHLFMVPQHNGYEDVPLALYVRDYQRTKDVVVEFNHDPKVLTRAAVERVVGHIGRMVSAALADPGLPLARLPLLDEAGRRRVLEGYNASERAYPQERCVHELFEQRVHEQPGACALQCDGQVLSYGQLNARANRLARHLRQLGVQTQDRVAVALPRGPELLVALLAVFKAGGAYLPLDPEYPAQRLAYMVEDAAPKVLLSLRALAAQRPALPPGLVLVELEDGAAWAQQAAHDLPAAELGLHSRALAYVIYTSGSTGRPKGVMIEHRSLVNYTLDAIRVFGLEPADTVLQQNSLNFDLSLEEMLPALLAGACLVPRQEPLGVQAQPAGATVLHLTAAHWHALVGQWALEPALARAQLGGVRLINVTGDALSPHKLAQWEALVPPTLALVNTYGPTEAAVSCSAQRVRHAPGMVRVPIGKPMANVRLYVLDAQGEPVPEGVVGEIHIGGHGVARGYLGREQLTAERFVPDPFAAEPLARMYRTGDLACWLEDGRLEYVGRVDHQIKVRGYRVEPGEIESCMLQQPGVREAVVLAREDEAGHKRLVAYWCGPATQEQLREQLGQRLPQYMLPAAYVALPAMPLTPNGKLDRQALPEPGAAARRAQEPPQGPLEQRLAALWQRLLSLPAVGRHDDFFELGGHSLLAVQMLARVRAELGVELSLGEVFAQPRLAGFARLAAAGRRASQPRPHDAARDGPAPLSFSQQRLWVLAQIDGRASGAYHMPGRIRLRGTLDGAALRRALQRIVERHEVLRSCFTAVDGVPVQQPAPAPLEFPLDRIDLRDAADAPAALQAASAREAAQPFDLERGPLVRGCLLQLAEDDHVLLLTMHHMVSDGWSIGLFVAEFSALYTAFALGRPDPLPPLAMQYADYAAWQRRTHGPDRLGRQIEFWRGHLLGAPGLLELPGGRPRPPEQDYAGARLEVVVDAPTTALVRALAQRHSVTLHMLLLAAWAALLSRWSGQPDLVIGTAVANRPWPELEPLIGFFVNTLALRVRCEPAMTGSELLAQVRATSIAAQEHQDAPFEQVVEALQPRRSMASSPLFQVMFTWQNTPSQALGLHGLQAELLPPQTVATPFDLDLSLQEEGAQLCGELLYATALFDRAGMQRLLDSWRILLR
ncbi:MAG TPA: amino acid adenylation domain-containing protein, partial [Burkholderiaceae bacterium]|nr:amino acid adenylation domain-containing protein [Burkholderiaceae bacterium]